MTLVERRPNERAMHETFLVIKAAANDLGSRPWSGRFTSQDVTVGTDGKPRAVVWNLGTREVRGVTTEFAYIPAGMAIHPDNKKLIGYGNPANINANSNVTVTCTNLWPHMSHADVLLVTAWHETDPVRVACDPLADRHVGQMNYPWAGSFEGVCPGPNGGKIAVQIRAANQGLYRVKVFVAENGRLPSNPQVDRTMAPNGVTFRWLQAYSFKREDWEFTMQDNSRLSVKCRVKFTDTSGRQPYELNGLLARLLTEKGVHKQA